jgi:formiminotetrahydrofolate cyclodeaminase
MSLASLSVHEFIEILASPTPTPGGGTAAAIAGAMGAGLLMMVAGLPRTRGNADDERAALAPARDTLAAARKALEHLADRDSHAFEAVMAAYRLPKGTDDEKAARKAAVGAALEQASDVPLDTLRRAVEALEVGATVARLGNPSASSDVLVGVGLLLAAAEGAAANVRVNLAGIGNTAYAAAAAGELERLMARAAAAADRSRAALGQ